MEYTTDQLICIERKKFIRASEDIQAIDDAGKHLKKDPSGLLNFRAKLSNLEKLFDTAMGHWDKLLELSVIAPEKVLPSEDDKSNYDLVTKWYYRIKETALAHEPPPQHSSGNSLTNTSMAATRVRLPKITLPEFSGRFADWPIFRDTYLSLIHEETNLSNIEKFHYLVGRLKCTALDVIKPIPITDDNYEQAWATLKRTFDSKRRLASSYLQKLLTVSPPKGRPTLASLNHFLSNVAESVSSFQNLKVPNSGDFLLFELAIRGLDPTTREAFEVAHTTTDFPSFSTLVKFIEQRCLALSMIVDQNESPTSSRPTSPPPVKQFKHVSFFANQSDESYQSDIDNSKTQLPCVVCSENHKVKDCRIFLNLLPHERYNKLKNWKGCYNCLISGHRTQHCRSPFCCRICGKRHHTLIHQPEKSANDSSTSSIPEPPSDLSSSSSTSAPSSLPSGSALTGMALKSPQVLLGTAKTLIQDSKGHFKEMRAIIDSGSQFSFITKECVKRLGLTLLPLQQTIVGIGESALEGALGRTVCHLRSPKHTASNLSTTAIVVTTIAPMLPQDVIPTNVKDSFLNANLDLADPNFWFPNPVDFLLGADLFGSILCSRQNYHPNVGQPYALSTVFGSVIMGPLPLPTDSSIARPITTFFVKQSSKVERFAARPNIAFIPKPSLTTKMGELVCLKPIKRLSSMLIQFVLFYCLLHCVTTTTSRYSDQLSTVGISNTNLRCVVAVNNYPTQDLAIFSPCLGSLNNLKFTDPGHNHNTDPARLDFRRPIFVYTAKPVSCHDLQVTQTCQQRRSWNTYQPPVQISNRGLQGGRTSHVCISDFRPNHRSDRDPSRWAGHQHCATSVYSLTTNM